MTYSVSKSKKRGDTGMGGVGEGWGGKPYFNAEYKGGVGTGWGGKNEKPSKKMKPKYVPNYSKGS